MKTIRQVAFCPHCGNEAPQRLICTHKYTRHRYAKGSDSPSINYPSAYYVAICETCNHILLYHTINEIKESKDFHLAERFWPDPKDHSVDLPETVRECYEEAKRIKKIAPDAFAGQIRKALEAICQERKAKGDTLHQCLKELESRGEFPHTLAEIANTLRLVGNEAVHKPGKIVKPEYVQAIDEFFYAVIAYVYVFPRRLEEFKEFWTKQINSEDV